MKLDEHFVCAVNYTAVMLSVSTSRLH